MAERTGPTLPGTHWAVEVVRRAEVIGILDGYLPAQRAVPLEVVDRALRAMASSSDTAQARNAELWRRWLADDYPFLHADSVADASDLAIAARALVGGLRRVGNASPGKGEFEPDRTGAIPLPDGSDVLGVADVTVIWGEHLGLRVLLEQEGDRSRAAVAEAALGLGPIRVSGGRSPVGYGYGFGGGITLTGEAALDAVQVSTREPFTLPSVLRHLGPVSVHAFAGWMREDRHPDDPYIWGASGQIRPHRRLTLGVHRAALFGGDSEQPVTFGRVLDMLVGRVGGIGFEDQVVSVSMRAILPTERTLPLEAFLEWGAEDAAGAWFDVPGRVLGLWAPALPGAPNLGFGVEYAGLASSCCGNPSWYRHWSFNGSWASRDLTLGHPVGGDGSELLLHTSLQLPSQRALVRAGAFRRNRGAENLYSPGRTGRSFGVEAIGDWAPTERVRVAFSGSRESGSGWAETNLRIHGGVVF